VNGRIRQGNHEHEANLGYITRLCLKIPVKETIKGGKLMFYNSAVYRTFCKDGNVLQLKMLYMTTQPLKCGYCD
jgi:hypothetical protein